MTFEYKFHNVTLKVYVVHPKRNNEYEKMKVIRIKIMFFFINIVFKLRRKNDYFYNLLKLNHKFKYVSGLAL